MGRRGRPRRWLRALLLLLPVAAVVLWQLAGRRPPVSAPPGFDPGGGPAGGPQPGGPGPRPDDGSGGGPGDGGVREPRRPKPGPSGVAEHRPEPVESEFLEPGQPDRVVVGDREP